MKNKIMAFLFAALSVCFICPVSTPAAADTGGLEAIRARGELRHLGIPYANFIIDSEAGLEVEVMKRFATHLGVKYRFVKSNWAHIFSDLIGKKVTVKNGKARVSGTAPVKGDIIGTGLTELGWRKQILSYSEPTFPTQVWCIAGADFPSPPINGSNDIKKDIRAVKQLLRGKRIMGKEGTCLAPGLYGIDATVGQIINFPGNLNDIAPALIKNSADVALLDVPDALVALEKWPGKIKVLGPLSEKQIMGAGFRKQDTDLRKEFNSFFESLKGSGEYKKLVKKYYPAVFKYFDSFFKN